MSASTGRGGPPRIAIAGSEGPLGKALRELIEESTPDWMLTLLDTDEYTGLLREFEEYIQIANVLPPERIAGADAAVFACDSMLVNRYLDGLPLPPVALDLSGGERSGFVFVEGRAAAREAGPRLIVAPRAATIVLTRLLSALHDAFGVEDCEATVLEPASEAGPEGVRRLQEQTVQMLNFQTVEAAGEPVAAFNLIGPDAASVRRAARLSRQVGALCPEGCPAPSLQLGQAAVFEGMVISAHVRVGADVSLSELRDALAQDRRLDLTPADARSTPIGVVGAKTIRIPHLSESSAPGAFWMWVLADNLGLAADNARAALAQIFTAA